MYVFTGVAQLFEFVISESENHWFEFFQEKIQNPVDPSYFKTFKELVVFMKEPTGNELMVLWSVI
jgi:hypothetical protein